MFTSHGAAVTANNFCDVFLVEEFAADFVGVFEVCVVVVACGHAVECVVDEDVFGCAEGAVFFGGWSFHAFVKFLDHFHELVGFGWDYVVCAADGDGFEVFAAHDCAESGASCGSGFFVYDGGDAGEFFSGYADGGYADVVVA